MTKKRFFLLIAIFILFAIAATFPLVFKINTAIPGFQHTDEPYAALWNFWWLKHCWQKHLPDSFPLQVAVPFDRRTAESGYLVWNTLNKWLTILTSNIFTYNIEILLSFVLSGIFMCLLVFYLAQDFNASIFSGIIYMFLPYHFVRAWQHLGLAQIQWMPLYLLALLRITEKISKPRIVGDVIALFLVFSFDLYHAYLMLNVTALYAFFFLCFRQRSKLRERSILKDDIKKIAAIFLVVMSVLILISPTILTTFKHRKDFKSMPVSAHNPFRRPFEDLFTQSAKPLSYVLPSPEHPVFGKITEQFVGSSLYGESFTEHVLYLGWTPLVLAFIAMRGWLRRQKQSPRVHQATRPHENDENFYIGFFVFLAFAAWLFSQPPWWDIFGFKLYMPSFFMYKILPMFRAYCRFGIVVMLAVAVLAGFGLKFILEGFSRYSGIPQNAGKPRKIKIAVSALFCGLVLFEFWNWPPYKVIDVSKVPEVYYWLKQEPADIVIAEYPLDADSPNELYKFFQAVHEKKIVNGAIPGTYASKVAQTMRRLSEPKTASYLKWMRVKYVIVHKADYLKTDLVEDKEDVENAPYNPGLKFIKAFPAQECAQKDIMCAQKTGPIDVYAVVAEPLEPHIVN